MNTIKYLFSIFFFLSMFPLAALAAEFRVPPPFGSVHEGDTFIVDVTLSSYDDPVNAFEGSLAVSPNISIVEIRTARSVVPLWIQEPTRESENTVTFAGFIPGGFEGILGTSWIGYRAGTLFRLVVRAHEEGEGSVSFGDDVMAYRNDGEGTSASVTALGTVFPILPRSDSTKTISAIGDSTPPEEFTLSVIDGAFFEVKGEVLVFGTQDKQTRIAYYEIARSLKPKEEGDLSWKRIESPYQLSYGDRAKYLYVRALDEAGNTRLAVLTPEFYGIGTPAYLWVIVLILLLTGISTFFRSKHFF